MVRVCVIQFLPTAEKRILHKNRMACYRTEARQTRMCRGSRQVSDVSVRWRGDVVVRLRHQRRVLEGVPSWSVHSLRLLLHLVDGQHPSPLLRHFRPSLRVRVEHGEVGDDDLK